MDTQRKITGDKFEDLALSHLQTAGLKLLIRNHRCKGGEIDLVMLDGNTLVLIEVRYRRDRSFGGAAASVTNGKQRRLTNAARHLLQTHRELQKYRARFDLIAIDTDAHAVPKLNWIKAAFRTT